MIFELTHVSDEVPRIKRETHESNLQLLRLKCKRLIAFYNSHAIETDQKISQDNVETGSFPWKKPTSNYLQEFFFMMLFLKPRSIVPFEEKLKAVEAWMLWQRAQEEKIQSENEMRQYLRSINQNIVALRNKRDELLSTGTIEPSHSSQSNRSSQKICQHKAVLALLAIRKLELQQNNAIVCFRRDPTLLPVTYPGIDYSLERQSDDEEGEDSEECEDSEESEDEKEED